MQYTWVQGGRIGIPYITKSMVTKRRRKILRQPSQTLLYNFGLYLLFINMQISFFPKSIYMWEGLYPRGLMTFIYFKFGGPISGWACYLDLGFKQKTIFALR